MIRCAQAKNTDINEMYHCTWPSTWLIVSFNRKIGSKKIEKSISLFQRPKKPIKNHKHIKRKNKQKQTPQHRLGKKCYQKCHKKYTTKNPIKFDTKNAKHNKHLFFAITNYALHTMEY